MGVYQRMRTFEQVEEYEVIVLKICDLPQNEISQIQGNFFMNFVMTRGWTGYAVEILEPYPLFSGFVWKHVFRKQQYGPYVASLSYYRALPNFLLFIFIGFIYAIIAPLMLPFLMIYFVAGYIVYRNQVIIELPCYFIFLLL